MSNDLIASLERVMSSGDEGLQQIDSKIAEHEKQIQKLRSMRRILVGANNPPARSRGNSIRAVSKDQRQGLRDQIKALITERGPMRARDIGDQLGISYIAVGFIVRDDKEITRQGKYLQLA